MLLLLFLLLIIVLLILILFLLLLIMVWDMDRTGQRDMVAFPGGEGGARTHAPFPAYEFSKLASSPT